MRRVTSMLLLSSAVLAGAAALYVSTSEAQFSGGPFGGAGQSGSGGSATTSAPTFTSTQTNGGAGFCFNGSCAVSLASDGGVVTLTGAEFYAPNGFTDSQKVNPDTIITPYSVVPQAASGQAAFRVAQTGARVYFDVGGNIYCYSDGSQVVCGSAWKIQSLSVDTIGTYTDARNKVEIFYPQPYPLGSLASCSSGVKGRLETLSSDGRTYACDGTTTQRVGYSLSNTASIDWGSLGPNDTETKTMTVTGAVTSDWVGCIPVNGGTMQGMDMHPTVTSADTVSIIAHNDTGGTIDPTAMDIKCVVVR